MSDNNLQQANRNVALKTAEQALRKAGAKAPSTLAKALVDQGRVRADLTKGPGHVEVRTPEGTPRINSEGDRMSVKEFTSSWLDENPELKADSEASSGGEQAMEARFREKVAKVIEMKRDGSP